MTLVLLRALWPMGRLPHRGQLSLLLFFKASLLLSQLGMLPRMLLRTFVFLLRFFVGCHRFLRTRSELKENASDNARVHFVGRTALMVDAVSWSLVEHRSCI
jgi:hypothetical protein